MNRKQNKENRINFERKFNFFYRKLNYIDLYREYKNIDSEYKTNIYKQEIKEISGFYKIEVEDSDLEYLLERKSILERKLDNSKNQVSDTMNKVSNLIFFILGIILGSLDNLSFYETNVQNLSNPDIYIIEISFIVLYIATTYYSYNSIKNGISDSIKDYQKESFLRSLMEYELSLANNKINHYIKNLSN